MDVICFGQQNWDACWTAKQQLSTRLARRGHRVLYVDPIPAGPREGIVAAARSAFPPVTGLGLREVEPGLHVYTDHHCPLFGRRLNARRGHWVMQALVRRLGIAFPITLVLTPYKRWLKEGVRPAARVYYAVDEWTAFAGLEQDRAWVRREEEALLRESDLALAVSPRLYERFVRVQPRTRLLENAADVEHFSPARLADATAHSALLALPPGPRLGFVGQVDERIDQQLLLHLARHRPQWQIVLAGRVRDGADVSALVAAPNIHLLGYVPYLDLPRVMREFDACLVPYRLTELTRSCCPLKAYEYLATGKPVVSTPLDGLGACRDAVALAGDAPEALRALDAALANPAAGRSRRLATAAAHSWDVRVDALEQHLDEAMHAAASRAPAGRGLARAAPPAASPAVSRATAPRTLSPPAVARRTMSARRVKPPGVRLDAKDESERQLRDNFARHRMSPAQRAFFEVTRAAGWAYYGLRCAARLTQGRRPFDVAKILVVRKAMLGDLVAFLPTLAALRRRYPHARIVLGVQPNMSAAQLLAGSQDVDEVRVLDFMAHPSRAVRLRGAWDLFRQGFDVLVCGVSYFLIQDAFYCGAPRRVGLYDGHPLQRLCTDVIPLDARRHEADNNLALVEALGCGASGAERAPSLRLPEAALARAASRAAGQIPVPAGATLVAVHPGSKRPSRRWPAERFAALVRRLLEARPDVHVVFTGVPDERALVDSILAGLPATVRARGHSGVGLTDLPSLVALLDRSAAVVCNDTGVMHLARARGRPLLALLGPENDRRWGPHPVGSAPAIALRHHVPCAPCVRWTCEAHYCMLSLSVDEAADALDRLLDGTAGAPGGAAVPAAGAVAALDAGGGAGGTADLPGDGSPPRRLPLPLLEQQSRRHTWRDLAASGFELPAVTVVVWSGETPPNFTGAGTGTGPVKGEGAADAIGEATIARAARVARRQDYPNLQVIALLDADTTPALGRGPWPRLNNRVETVAVPGSAGGEAAWSAALAAARGHLVVSLHGGDDWPADRVGAQVAPLVRSPAAAAAGAGRVYTRAAVLSGGPAARPEHGTMYQREVLQALLDQAALPNPQTAPSPGDTARGGEDGGAFQLRSGKSPARWRDAVFRRAPQFRG